MKAYLVAINSKYIHPAMGVFSLVCNSRHPVIYDEFTIKDKKEKIIKSILEKEYELLCFSVYIWNSTIVKEIIKDLRTSGFNKPILLGGPETYYNSELFLKEYNVNYVIFGEGEESFNELLDYLDNKTTIDTVSNLYYLDNNNNLKFTYAKLPNINNIKQDLSLIKDFDHRVAYLESSRGCPFKCSYCMASLEPKVRFFPLEKVKKEIKFLLDNNCRTIKFLDRSFNINKDYMLDILKFIKENDNGISVFQFEIVGDLLDKDIIKYINENMRKGILRFEIGVQSTNDQTTKAVCRKQDFNKLKKNVELLKDTVTLHVDLIAGLPYEDFSSFKNSFNETYLLMGDELQLGFLKELKGTKISKEKDNHLYNFDNKPPYEIISNKYINETELNIIRKVEISLEKYHNKGCFKRSLNYLFIQNKLDPFDTFLQLTTNSEKELKYLNDDEAYKYLFEQLRNKVNEQELLNNIKLDYLLKNKMKPKIWWNYTLSKEERNNYFNLFNKKYNIDSITFYNYSYLDVIDDEAHLFIYKDNKVTLIRINLN
jgi:radical SAM superfamily enzyme YgiQ (UPF0313 family)